MGELLADAQLYEPLPYRSALADGCTHVLVLRTRPDGLNCARVVSMAEKAIYHRWFIRKNGLDEICAYMSEGGHRRVYAEDIALLNECSRVGIGSRREGSGLGALAGRHEAPAVGAPSDGLAGSVLALALEPGDVCVGQLERRREHIFEAVRSGFARAVNAIEGGGGDERASLYFPNEILEYPTDPALPQPWPEAADERYEGGVYMP